MLSIHPINLTSMHFTGKLIYKGVKARNALLQGTKKVALYPSEGINGAKQFRYTKPGSWAQAQRDFYAIQPTNIERGNMVGNDSVISFVVMVQVLPN